MENNFEFEFLAYGQDDVFIRTDDNEMSVDKIEFCQQVGVPVKSEGFWADDNWITTTCDYIEDIPLCYWEPSQKMVADYLATT